MKTTLAGNVGGPEAMRAIFTRVAGRYDILNRALTFGIDVMWRRRALKGLASPARVLDLATGTADLALELARKFPCAHITGADLTPAMLNVGRQKVAKASLGERIKLVEGNAMALEFANGSFDLLTCAFGFRNFPDKAKALDEAHRVLQAGGTLLVLELFRNRLHLFAKFTSWWLCALAPILSPRTKADYEYLRRSISATLSADEFITLARAHGFELVHRRFFLPACWALTFKRARKSAQ